MKSRKLKQKSKKQKSRKQRSHKRSNKRSHKHTKKNNKTRRKRSHKRSRKMKHKQKRKYKMVEVPQINDRVASLFQLPNGKFEFFHGTIREINVNQVIVQFDDETMNSFDQNDDHLISIPKMNEQIQVLWNIEGSAKSKYYKGMVTRIYKNAYTVLYEDGQEYTHEFRERTWKNTTGIKFDSDNLVGDMLIQRAEAAVWQERQAAERARTEEQNMRKAREYHEKMVDTRLPRDLALSRHYKEQVRPPVMYEGSGSNMSITLNDVYEKSGPTTGYEYEWLKYINDNIEAVNSLISDDDITKKIQDIIGSLDSSTQSKIQQNKISMPKRINPFVQVYDYVGDRMIMENAGPTNNQVRNWLNNLAQKQRQQSSVRLLYYLSYALLIMDRLGVKHNDLTNPDNVHILGTPENLHIKIFDPKVEDKDDTKPDIEGVRNIITLTLQEGSLQRPPSPPRRRKARSNLTDELRTAGMGGGRRRMGGGLKLFYN